jgi:hypothetical protein
MKQTIKTNLFYLFIAAGFTFAIYSCSNNTVTNTPSGPDANSINGTVTFADSNFGSGHVGTYEVVAFAQWPPTGPPSASDTLKYSKVGNVYKGTYELKNVSNGSYVVASGWRTTVGWQSPGLGIYGCDTSHTCWMTLTPNVTISNNTGVTGKDFLSWADTTKKIF